MYSGFITTKHVVKQIGIHQRFDMAAYRMISSYLKPDDFPTLKQVLHFEGYNGPDGLKVKSPGVAEPSHLYDPFTDTGEVPQHIKSHYQKLVQALIKDDMIRAAFEASWLAHYVGDGLTPAHHYPLENMIDDLKKSSVNTKSMAKKNFMKGRTPLETFRKNWAMWGSKGLYTTHFNFEMGVAAALALFPIRVKLDDAKLALARQTGPIEFFKHEAREVSSLDLYNKFIRSGWTAEVAATVKNRIAPQAAQAIGIIWLLAYLEADMAVAKNMALQSTKPATTG